MTSYLYLLLNWKSPKLAYEVKGYDWSVFSAECRKQNKSDSKVEFCFWKGRKHFRNGENAGYQYFLLFRKCFQKTFLKGC